MLIENIVKSTIVKSGFYCGKLICCIRMFHKDFCGSSKRHTILWTVNILELSSLNSFEKLVLGVPETTGKKLYSCLRELETTGPRPVSWRCYVFAKIGTQGVLGHWDCDTIEIKLCKRQKITLMNLFKSNLFLLSQHVLSTTCKDLS